MRNAWMILLTTVMVVVLSGCCCFDHCGANRGVYSQPTAQIVQPPLDACVVK